MEKPFCSQLPAALLLLPGEGGRQSHEALDMISLQKLLPCQRWGLALSLPQFLLEVPARSNTCGLASSRVWPCHL